MVVWILKLINKDEYNVDKVFHSYAEAERYIAATNRHYYVPVKAEIRRLE